MRALYFFLAVAAVDAELAHRGRRGRLRAAPPRDGRDVTRAKDEAQWKAHEEQMAQASAELNKLHAERDHLKEEEVTVLQRRESATKSAMEDATLVIQRLEGQVASQERELAKQKATISGLEHDLVLMGKHLLTDAPCKTAPPKEAPVDKKEARLVEGLEQDVKREGQALLQPEQKATIREKLLSRAARGLADRTHVLEAVLEREGSASARTLAVSISTDAKKLEHALLHSERPEDLNLAREEDLPREEATDVARAVESERRPGAAHLEPAELEQPERIAEQRAVERAQMQRADERDVQQAELERPRARRAPRVHRPQEPAPVADAESADLDAPDTQDAPDDADVPDMPDTLANTTLPDEAAAPAVLSSADRLPAADAADADADAPDAAVEEEAADDSDDDSDAPAVAQSLPPAEREPESPHAQRLSA